MIEIGAFAADSSEIPEQQFTDGAILESMRDRPVLVASLHPHLFFSSEHYKRNLIPHTPLFYSRPFNQCNVDNLKSKRYETDTLSNTSEDGRLSSGLPVVKVALA